MNNGTVQKIDINEVNQMKFITAEEESDDTIEPRDYDDEFYEKPDVVNCDEVKPKKPAGRPRKHPEYYDDDGKYNPKKYRTLNKEKHTKDQKTDKKCACGLIVQKGNMPRHLKSKFHKRGVTFLENSDEHIE